MPPLNACKLIYAFEVETPLGSQIEQDSIEKQNKVQALRSKIEFALKHILENRRPEGRYGYQFVNPYSLKSR